MKKFLCLVITFVLYFSASVVTTAEQNKLEFGPLSFSESFDWTLTFQDSKESFIGLYFSHIEDESVFFTLTVQDVWNDLISDEKRLEIESKGIQQKEFDSLPMAYYYMALDANALGIDADLMETVKIGDYEFCQMISRRYTDDGCYLYDAPEYKAVINGYLIEMLLFIPMDTAYFSDFEIMMDTLDVGLVSRLQ